MPPATTAAQPLDIVQIEDNPGDVRLTKEAVAETEINHTFHVFPTGDSAIESILDEDTPWYPDLILLDLNLPGKDGREILGTMQRHPRLQRLPVVILTSSDAGQDIRRSYEANANAYLTKPDDLDGFVSLMESIEAFWVERAKLP